MLGSQRFTYVDWFNLYSGPVGGRCCSHFADEETEAHLFRLDRMGKWSVRGGGLAWDPGTGLLCASGEQATRKDPSGVPCCCCLDTAVRHP